MKRNELNILPQKQNRKSYQNKLKLYWRLKNIFIRLVKTFNRSPFIDTHFYFPSQFWSKKHLIQEKKKLKWLRIFWLKRYFLQHLAIPFTNINFTKNKLKIFNAQTFLYISSPFLKKNHQTSSVFFTMRNVKQFLRKKTRNCQINFKPILHKKFLRNMYFFLHFVKKSKTWVNNFQNKIKHFKMGYTFVNTTYLKKYIVRRFSREMFFSKFGLSWGLTTLTNCFSYKNHKQFSYKLQPLDRYLGFLWFDNYRTHVQVLPEPVAVPLKYITRVRFKPGYYRQWRTFRTDLKKFLNIRLPYQKRLTTLVQNLFFYNQKKLEWSTQTRIVPFLAQTSLLPDLWSAQETINSQGVFVNGTLCTNDKLKIFFNDFVQLIINIKYYVVTKWLLNWSLTKSIRLTKLNRKLLKKRLSSSNGNYSRNLPDWLLGLRYSKYDIPRCFEVDYFSLSVFLISNTNYLECKTSDLNSNTYTKIFNLYNWKYIT